MGTKTNPGHFDCHAAAAPDEPLFTLLGRDPRAPGLVRAWADQREAAARDAGPEELVRVADKVAEARDLADAMDAWRWASDSAGLGESCCRPMAQHLAATVDAGVIGPGAPWAFCPWCAAPAGSPLRPKHLDLAGITVEITLPRRGAPAVLLPAATVQVHMLQAGDRVELSHERFGWSHRSGTVAPGGLVRLDPVGSEVEARVDSLAAALAALDAGLEVRAVAAVADAQARGGAAAVRCRPKLDPASLDGAHG